MSPVSASNSNFAVPLVAEAVTPTVTSLPATTVIEVFSKDSLYTGFTAFFVTVTVYFTFFPFALTVMTAFPAFKPVTVYCVLEIFFTVATFLLLEVAEDFPITLFVIVKLADPLTEIVPFVAESFGAGGFFTVTFNL